MRTIRPKCQPEAAHPDTLVGEECEPEIDYDPESFTEDEEAE